jgi:hypothetical protein
MHGLNSTGLLVQSRLPRHPLVHVPSLRGYLTGPDHPRWHHAPIAKRNFWRGIGCCSSVTPDVRYLKQPAMAGQMWFQSTLWLKLSTMRSRCPPPWCARSSVWPRPKGRLRFSFPCLVTHQRPLNSENKSGWHYLSTTSPKEPSFQEPRQPNWPWTGACQACRHNCGFAKCKQATSTNTGAEWRRLLLARTRDIRCSCRIAIRKRRSCRLRLHGSADDFGNSVQTTSETDTWDTPMLTASLIKTRGRNQSLSKDSVHRF